MFIEFSSVKFKCFYIKERRTTGFRFFLFFFFFCFFLFFFLQNASSIPFAPGRVLKTFKKLHVTLVNEVNAWKNMN
jgi:hypothetical protein